MAYFSPWGKRLASDRTEAWRRSAVSRAFAVGSRKTAMPTDGLPSMRQRVSMAPGAQLGAAHVAEVGHLAVRAGLEDDAGELLRARLSRPSVLIVYWKSRPFGDRRLADLAGRHLDVLLAQDPLITSVAVRLRDASLSGSSQTRML